MIDLLYVSYNRLIYTQESFTALIANTNWGEVETLYVMDDNSHDGSREYLEDAAQAVEATVVFNPAYEKLGGPVDAMNRYLETSSDEIAIFGKVDNDMVVPPGWLDDMLVTLRYNVEVDILGMEPFLGHPAPCPARRSAEEARHIGGKGLIRKRAYGHCRMVAHGYQGFTQWQEKHPEIIKAWVNPDLPCFGLDQLPFEPWTSIAADYVERGWHRPWPPYSPDATGYWGWWKPVTQ